MEAISPRHRHLVYEDYLTLLSERHLPMDVILNTIVLAQGAIWKHRMFQEEGNLNGKSSAPPGESTLVENEMFLHLLDVHSALLQVGVHELKEPVPSDTGGDLAQRITATFRRTLGSLRIASKWLRVNIMYIQRDPEFLAYQVRESRNGREVSKENPNQPSKQSVETLRFWQAYVEFVGTLSSIYPMDKLPEVAARLDEDVELKGFMPLRQFADPANDVDYPEQHPNEEQLMRIRGILEDANVIVDVPVSLCFTLPRFHLNDIKQNSPLERRGNAIIVRHAIDNVKSFGDLNTSQLMLNLCGFASLYGLETSSNCFKLREDRSRVGRDLVANIREVRFHSCQGCAQRVDAQLQLIRHLLR